MYYFIFIDYCILVGLITISLTIGSFFAWKDRNKSNDEYLTGGRKMKVLPVTFSLLASYLCAFSFFGFPVEVYTRGTQVLLSILANIIAAVIAANVFMPIYYKINAISVNQYLLERYESKALQVMVSTLMSVSAIPLLGTVLFTPALALRIATGISNTTSILLTALTVTIYTAIGGVKAVIWTDVVQFVLMIAGMLAIIIKGTNDVGGVGEVLERNNQGGRIELFNFEFNPYMQNNFWVVVLGTGFVFTASQCCDQMAVQRMITLPKIADVKKALYLTMIGLIIIHVTVVYIGMLIFAYFYKCDPSKTGQISRTDEIVTLFVGEIFNSNKYPGLFGLFVTSIVSSSLSTLSSGLAAISALIWQDWLKALLPNVNSSTSLLITKSLSIAVSFLMIAASFLVMKFASILDAVFTLLGVPIGPTFGVYFLGVIFPNVNAKGAITGMIFGLTFSLFVVVGSLTHKLPQSLMLPTTTDGCDVNLYPNVTRGTPFETLKYSRIPSYKPTGINLIYHLSPMFLPVCSFAITVIVANIVSAYFRNNREINSVLICNWVNKLRAHKMS